MRFLLLVTFGLLTASPAVAQDEWDTTTEGIRILRRTVQHTNRRGQPTRTSTVHAVIVDLEADGVSVETTPHADRWKSVTEVGRTRRAAAVVNGGFWNGFAQAQGVAAGGGERWPGSEDDEEHGFFAINADGRAFISPPEQVVGGLGRVRQAVSGRPLLAHRGQLDRAGLDELDWARHRHPRTGVGVSEDGKTVIVAVVDGRQQHSAGMTLYDLGDLLIELGAWDAINLDGGGSSAMYLRDHGGVANSPSGGRWENLLGVGAERTSKRRTLSDGTEESYVRGVEREVLNHILVFAPEPEEDARVRGSSLPDSEPPYALPPRRPLFSLGQARELIYPAVWVSVPALTMFALVWWLRRRRRRVLSSPQRSQVT